MNLTTEWITYGKMKKYRGYIAKPARIAETAPAVLVIQEFWGLDEYLRDVAHRIAQAGYIAFAPDLYSENGKRLIDLSEERILEAKEFLNSIPQSDWQNIDARNASLSRYSQEQRDRIDETTRELFNWPNNIKLYMENVLEAVSFLRHEYHYAKGQRIGSVGFCLGGGVSALLACHDAELDGAVVFYGNAPSAELVPQINCPVLGFYGDLDKPFTGQVPGFAQSMEKHGKSFEYHIYENARHAFFNDTRPMYNARASRDAFARTLSFFNQTLNRQK